MEMRTEQADPHHDNCDRLVNGSTLAITTENRWLQMVKLGMKRMRVSLSLLVNGTTNRGIKLTELVDFGNELADIGRWKLLHASKR